MPALPVMLVMLITGCGSRYGRSDAGVNSPAGRKITAMLKDLHAANDAAVDRFVTDHGATGLTPDQSTGLHHLLKSLASADAVTLTRLDRFGDQVYRAALSVRRGSDTKMISVLLVEHDDKLLWAGPN